MEITPGWETVEVVMDPSGRVEARIGASPHGQGLRTTLAQIVADQLGVAPADVRVLHGDTDRTPYGWGTFASRSLVISGGATLLGGAKNPAKNFSSSPATCWKLRRTISCCRTAAPKSPAPIAPWRSRRWRAPPIISRIASRRSRRAWPRAAHYDPPGTFSNACHVAIVEVDVETGRVKLEKFLAVEDAGRIINPMIADGQVHGGIAQGIGNALFEEIVYDGLGNIQTATLADYLPPTACEIPPIELHHIETPAASSVTGAKGLGEGGAIGAPAAVLNAINDALSPFDVSIDEIPATPQRIRAALRAAARAR